MARRTNPPAPQPANLTVAEIEAAIPKIQRRISDLEAFDPDTIQSRDDPELATLQQRLETMVQDVFGHGTVEHDRYAFEVSQLDRAGFSMGGPTPIHEVIESVKSSVQYSVATLNGIVRDFEEKLEDAGRGMSARPIRAYDGLDLHKAVERAAGALFRDGHYSQAIFESTKALNNIVRLISGVEDRDGIQLMEFVFNPKNPILRFNSLQTDSDKEEQKGYMMMFCGAVAGLRNPRAHSIIKDAPERSLEFIGFVSLLAKLCDDTERNH